MTVIFFQTSELQTITNLDHKRVNLAYFENVADINAVALLVFIYSTIYICEIVRLLICKVFVQNLTLSTSSCSKAYIAIYSDPHQICSYSAKGHFSEYYWSTPGCFVSIRKPGDCIFRQSRLLNLKEMFCCTNNKYTLQRHWFSESQDTLFCLRGCFPLVSY